MLISVALEWVQDSVANLCYSCPTPSLDPPIRLPSPPVPCPRKLLCWLAITLLASPARHSWQWDLMLTIAGITAGPESSPPVPECLFMTLGAGSEATVIFGHLCCLGCIRHRCQAYNLSSYGFIYAIYFLHPLYTFFIHWHILCKFVTFYNTIVKLSIFGVLWQSYLEFPLGERKARCKYSHQ